MQTIKLNYKSKSFKIEHHEKIMLIGSCFTEHIGTRLKQAKWQTCINPRGILFNPLSVANCLTEIATNQPVDEARLFLNHEIWHHWDFHSAFSHIDRNEAIQVMQNAMTNATRFLQHADWLIITLGSAFQYYLCENDYPVSNCHRAPAQGFEKKMLQVATIEKALEEALQNVWKINAQTKVIFTISPVRHIREGVVENNRSKARLQIAVQNLEEKWEQVSYFPAYEWIIDVLRDYRYYDVDMVHPNFAATNFVWEQFMQQYFSEKEKGIAQQFSALQQAFQHRSRFPETIAHQQFLQQQLQTALQLQQLYPYVDLTDEIAYFSGNKT